MREQLSNLTPTSAPYKVGGVWVVKVARRGISAPAGPPLPDTACVTFRTKREAVAFAGGAR